MQLDLIRGNAPVVSALQAALAKNRLAHAVLLCAPDGCGRNFAARCLAADYLFPQYPASHAAVKAVMAGESPEVMLVEGEGKSGQIPIARIRAVRTDVHLSALSAAGRVVHIRNAHHMAAPAANALLKVLEEPPADVLFILTAHSPAALPATIISRCILYTLAPLAKAECAHLLQQALPPGADPQLPETLATLYDGRLGTGLAVLQDAARLAITRDGLTAAKAAAARNEYALLQLLSGYEGRADGDREKRSALLSDMACVLDAALRGDTVPGLAAMPRQVAAMLLRPIMDAQQALDANVTPKVVFTALGVRLSRVGLPS